jgi:GNAT superfamily N-acetyltransferase
VIDILLRPAVPTDAAAVARFYDELSNRSSYSRFFGLRPARLDALLPPAGGSDRTGHIMVVALDGDEVVGVGDAFRTADPSEAEVAFAVADRCQHEGVATRLMSALATTARAAGVCRLVAVTLAGNQPMLHVLRSLERPTTMQFDRNEVRVDIDLVDDALAYSDARWRSPSLAA